MKKRACIVKQWYPQEMMSLKLVFNGVKKNKAEEGSLNNSKMKKKKLIPNINLFLE